MSKILLEFLYITSLFPLMWILKLNFLYFNSENSMAEPTLHLVILFKSVLLNLAVPANYLESFFKGKRKLILGFICIFNWFGGWPRHRCCCCFFPLFFLIFENDTRWLKHVVLVKNQWYKLLLLKCQCAYKPPGDFFENDAHASVDVGCDVDGSVLLIWGSCF